MSSVNGAHSNNTAVAGEVSSTSSTSTHNSASSHNTSSTATQNSASNSAAASRPTTPAPGQNGSASQTSSSSSATQPANGGQSQSSNPSSSQSGRSSSAASSQASSSVDLSSLSSTQTSSTSTTSSQTSSSAATTSSSSNTLSNQLFDQLAKQFSDLADPLSEARKGNVDALKTLVTRVTNRATDLNQKLKQPKFENDSNKEGDEQKSDKKKLDLVKKEAKSLKQFADLAGGKLSETAKTAQRAVQKALLQAQQQIAEAMKFDFDPVQDQEQDFRKKGESFLKKFGVAYQNKKSQTKANPTTTQNSQVAQKTKAAPTTKAEAKVSGTAVQQQQKAQKVAQQARSEAALLKAAPAEVAEAEQALKSMLASGKLTEDQIEERKKRYEERFSFNKKIKAIRAKLDEAAEAIANNMGQAAQEVYNQIGADYVVGVKNSLDDLLEGGGQLALGASEMLSSVNRGKTKSEIKEAETSTLHQDSLDVSDKAALDLSSEGSRLGLSELTQDPARKKVGYDIEPGSTDTAGVRIRTKDNLYVTIEQRHKYNKDIRAGDYQIPNKYGNDGVTTSEASYEVLA